MAGCGSFSVSVIGELDDVVIGEHDLVEMKKQARLWKFFSVSVIGIR
jgi:hypothetical protein